MCSDSGVYALALHVDSSSTIQIGRFGIFRFHSGNHLYIGSARGPGGITARVQRHIRDAPEKRRHWHVDWLREIAYPTGVLWSNATTARECEWAALLHHFGVREPVGFGASDCGCGGHLLRFISPAVYEHAIASLEVTHGSEVHFAHLDLNRQLDI